MLFNVINQINWKLLPGRYLPFLDMSASQIDNKRTDFTPPLFSNILFFATSTVVIIDALQELK